MNDQTDSQLLGAWAKTRSEPAFAELVGRHVDLVHSAAVRMVCDAHLAEDVTQRAFVALAKNAAHVAGHPVLSGWLHRTAQNIAAETVRSDVRRRAREQEAATMNELLAENGSGAGVPPAWSDIAPHLDAALGELSEPDRDAMLLRFFENKTLTEVGAVLGVSEDAARMRVNRALEKLRDFFAKRGVTVGASGLVVVISANAVQAAPVGLAATILTAATLAGTIVTTTATAIAIKTIAMTTLQKTIIGVTLAAAVGTGVFQAHQNSQLREQNQTLQQQQTPLAEQIHQLQRERDEATRQLAVQRDEIERLNRNASELLKLRGEVARLRVIGQNVAQPGLSEADNSKQLTLDRLARETKLKKLLEQTPGAKIPELQFLTDQDWIDATSNSSPDDDNYYRKALSILRNRAEKRVAQRIALAVRKFSESNNGQWPANLAQLKGYFDVWPMDETILQRYQILPGDSLPTISMSEAGEWLVTQKAVVDPQFDLRLAFGPHGYGQGDFEESEMIRTLLPAIKAYLSANNGQMPDNPAKLSSYATTSDQQAALQKAFEKFKTLPPEQVNEGLKNLLRTMQK